MDDHTGAGGELVFEHACRIGLEGIVSKRLSRPYQSDVTTRRRKASAHEAVASEARKGYDLLAIGIENTRTPEGGLTKEVTHIADGFEGALAVVVANGPQVAQELEGESKILVPVNGTEVSRRAVEIAPVVARSNHARITALYVTGGTQNSRRKRPRRGSASLRNEEAVLKEVTELADRYDTSVRTAMRVDVAADDAILKEARRGKYDRRNQPRAVLRTLRPLSG
jgi:Universal stress protein family